MCLDKIASNPGSYIQVDTTKIGISGHSYGGETSFNVAPNYATYGFPKPDFVVGIYPGGFSFSSTNAAAMPADVACVTISVSGDSIASDRSSSKWFRGITNVPNTEKAWIHINSESYGESTTSGGHFSCIGETIDDAVDWFGYIRIMDGLIDYKWELHNSSAFGKRFCLITDPNTYDWATDSADPNGLAYMGKWSDNHPHSPKEVHYFNDSTEYGGYPTDPPVTLEGFVVYDPSNLVNGAGETKDITATGTRFGDYVVIGPPYDLQGVSHSAYIKQDGTISLRLQNGTGGAINLGSGTWYWRIMKQY